MADEINKAKLFEKMAKVMGLVSRVSKGGWNDYHRYKYASADDVADEVRRAMAEAGLAFYPNLISIDKYEAGKEVRTHAVFEFTFGCSETGATLTCRWEAEADDTKDKGINKVATAAEKYFLLKTFIIGTGDEPDTDADGGEGDQPGTQTSGNSRKNDATGFDLSDKKVRANLIAAVGQVHKSLPQARIEAIKTLEADPDGFKGCVTFEDYVQVVVEHMKKPKAPIPYGQNPAANQPPPGVEEPAGVTITG